MSKKVNVSVFTCDHRENPTARDLRLLDKGMPEDNEVVQPEIGHIVDAKIFVSCPPDAVPWVEKNAIKLHDADQVEDLFWNGTEVVWLQNDEEHPLTFGEE